MAKKKTRDDFSEDTKRRAANRVNSLRSMCFQIIKAASAESSKSVFNLGLLLIFTLRRQGPAQGSHEDYCNLYSKTMGKYK